MALHTADALKVKPLETWQKWKYLQPWDMCQQLNSRAIRAFNGWLSGRLLRLYVV